VPTRKVTTEEVLSVHTKEHHEKVSSLEDADAEDLKRITAGYNSIYLNSRSGMCAELAAGSVCALTEKVVNGMLKNGVAIVRPPGHHAESHTCMGFCLYNNVAIAARQAVDKMGLKRVLIVDWDVHHGNGIQRIFLDDPSVLYFSVHRYDDGIFYPCSKDAAGTVVGEGRGEGYNVNVPWEKAHMGDGDYMAAWHQVLMPIALEFDPELVLVSAGFDAAEGDTLGRCHVTPECFAHLTHQLKALAGGKIVMALEGGYNLSSISNSFAACTRVLLGEDPPRLPSVYPSRSALEVIKLTCQAHSFYWRALAMHIQVVKAEDDIEDVTHGVASIEVISGSEEEKEEEDREGAEEDSDWHDPLLKTGRI
jgi:histone deacetylase 6